MGSAQDRWLRSYLTSNRATCTLTYWHPPRFSSGGHESLGSDRTYEPFWQALYDAGAEVVLAGHTRRYERFAPQTPFGQADPVRGIRQFIVSTGGVGHFPNGTPAGNSEVRNDDTFGVLKLTLRATGYDWDFVHEPGRTFTDSGSGSCH